MESPVPFDTFPRTLRTQPNASSFVVTLSEQPVPLASVYDVVGRALHRLSETVLSQGLALPSLLQLQLPLEPVSPLGWLAQQTLEKKVFWSSRDRHLTFAGAGEAEHLQSETLQASDTIWSTLRQLERANIPGLRYVGGMRFDALRSRSEHWSSWGASSWSLPRWNLSHEQDQCLFSVTLCCREPSRFPKVLKETRDELEQLVWSDAALSSFSPLQVLERKDSPDQQGWTERLEQSAQWFAEGSLDKIVWARETCLQCSGQPSPLAWLQEWEERSHDTFLFLFQPEHGVAFVGASPERLYAREGRQILCEALAGTAPRHPNPSEDARLGAELLASEKNRREQKFVFDRVQALLQECCSTVYGDWEPTLRRLQHVQHLWSELRGDLLDSITDRDLLERLHPTPAVGGQPGERAVELLASGEPFDRGWYAAPVGWIGPEGAELSVAIRSALVHHKNVYLYTGAGIVPGSQPDLEWQELAYKFKTFQDFFAMS
ncbi:MAG: isochorismate synthase [Deltaproteobacteria bacterium]|nr:MAG: isochorismate synthase [Deltaproteobacteria bacterium]